MVLFDYGSDRNGNAARIWADHKVNMLLSQHLPIEPARILGRTAVVMDQKLNLPTENAPPCC